MFALNKQALQRSEEALQGVKARLRMYGCYAHQLCEVGKLGLLLLVVCTDSKKSKFFPEWAMLSNIKVYNVITVYK
jgi:hypothetical protein